MQMEKEVHLICQNCSEHNGAEWRNNSATADVLLGKCHVCGEIKAITHIHYWKNVNSKFKFEVPPKASSQNISVQNKYDADLRELTTQKEITEQKILYLEKAFENLGFDIKDMKDILNKLVDNTLVPQGAQEVGCTQKPSKPAAKGKASQPDLFS